MLYKYKVTTVEGKKLEGSIEAPNIDIAINSLQRRNLIIVSINPEGEAIPFFERSIDFFEKVKTRDTVIFSRQIATMFEAKVPILDSLRLLASETENPLLAKKINAIAEDIQGGAPMSQALAKHADVFSQFYVNMVRSGEESGKLEEIFNYLADYLERSYELSRKIQRVLTYPAFVIFAFIVVMVLMLTVAIPRLGEILTESGGEIPFYTKVVLGTGNFMVNFGPYLFILIILGGIFFWRYLKTENGKYFISDLQLTTPYIGLVFKKIYVARFTDNLETLVSGGVPIVRAIDITADVVGNRVYSKILSDVSKSVKGGNSISDSLKEYDEIPRLVSQMIRVGEEGGKLGFMLKTLSRFYRREVDNQVETLISLIEPIMILVLGLMVGFLLMAVIVPLYNISSVI